MDKRTGLANRARAHTQASAHTRDTDKSVTGFATSWVTYLWLFWLVIGIVGTKTGVYLKRQELLVGVSAIFAVAFGAFHWRHTKFNWASARLGLVLALPIVLFVLLNPSSSGYSNIVWLSALLFLSWATPGAAQGFAVLGRRFAVFLVAGGVLLIPLAPSFVFAKAGTRILDSGSGERFVGLGFHPNDLAPLAVTTLLLFGFNRALSLFVRSVAIAGGAFSVFLSESRLAWVLAAGLAGWGFANQLGSSRRGGRSIRLSVLVTAAVGVITAVPVANFLLGKASQSELQSSNGRSGIWRFVASAWQEKILLGHGPQSWFELRGGVLPTWAWHAHNQGYQELFTRGLAGAVALGVVIVGVARTAIVNFNSSPHLLLALMGLVGIGYLNVPYTPEYVSPALLGCFLLLVEAENLRLAAATTPTAIHPDDLT